MSEKISITKKIKLKETSKWIFSLQKATIHTWKMWKIKEEIETLSKWNKFELLVWKEIYANILFEEMMNKWIISIDDSSDKILEEFKKEYNNVFWLNSGFIEWQYIDEFFSDDWLDLDEINEKIELIENNEERKMMYVFQNFHTDWKTDKFLRISLSKQVKFNFEDFFEDLIVIKEFFLLEEINEYSSEEEETEIKTIEFDKINYEIVQETLWFNSFDKFEIKFEDFIFNRRLDKRHEILLSFHFLNSETEEWIRLKVYLEDIDRKNFFDRQTNGDWEEIIEKWTYSYQLSFNLDSELIKSFNLIQNTWKLSQVFWMVIDSKNLPRF